MPKTGKNFVLLKRGNLLILLLLLLSIPIKANKFTASAYIHLHNDSLFTPDTLKTIDSTRSKPHKDTLKPIFRAPADDGLYDLILLGKKHIDRTDYKYIGNIIDYLPFGFLQDFGWLGQPSKFQLFGSNLNSIIVDGIDFTERHTNAFDLFLFRSEYINTLAIPLPTNAFLYSNANASSALNIFTFDRIAKEPYTRIRYYQAPNDEGFIDGYFNIHPTRKLNVYGGFQNSSTGSNYSYSEYGLWNADVKIRYMLNNTFNFLFYFNHSRSVAELNGGVDYEKLLSSFSSTIAQSILYDPFEAPVKFGNRYQKITRNNVVFKVLSRLLSKKSGEINVYYLTHLTEFRQDEKSRNGIFANDRFKTIGMNFLQPFCTGGFNLSVFGTSERTFSTLNSYGLEKSRTIFSLGGTLSTDFGNKKIMPVAFAKFSNLDGKSFLGYGINIKLHPIPKLEATLGASKFSIPRGIESEALRKIGEAADNHAQVFFASIDFKNSNFHFSFSIFNRKESNEEYWAEKDSAKSSKLKEKYVLYYRKNSTSGGNIFLSAKIWKIKGELNFTYYFLSKNEIRENPEFSALGGLFYIDTLFDKNLAMKTGVYFKSNGGQNYWQYEFQVRKPIYYVYSSTSVRPFGEGTTPFNWTLNLFFAGTIQKRATVYAVLENVFDNKYYIVPYYPMPSRTFRFGVAWEFLN